MSDDPRLGLPSGSSALQDSLCVGRWRAQREFDAMSQGLEEVEEEKSEGAPDDLDKDAEAGKRIHRLYAGEECPEATEPERQRAEKALHVDGRMHAEWLSFFQADAEAPIVEMREHRWWLKDESGKPIYSGQTDLVKIRGNKGGAADVLVGDLKGLWGYHDPAVQNQQIRRYIALIGATVTELGYTGMRSAAAYLNQPAKTLKPVMAQYELADIEAAMFEMHMAIAAMMAEDAPRTAGPIQCDKCRAKLLCAEYQESIAQLPVPLLGVGAAVPSKEQITDVMAKLPGEKLSQLLPWLPALTHTVDLAKAEAKRRLRQDVFSVPGYRLKKNPQRSKIVEIIKLWNRLTAHYAVSAEEFLNLCNVTKANVELIMRQKSGLKGKALETKIDSVLDGTTMPVKVSDSLEQGEPQIEP